MNLSPPICRLVVGTVGFSYSTILYAPWIALVAYWIFFARGNKRTAYQINPIWTWLPAVGFLAIVLVTRARPEFFNRPPFTQTWVGEAVGAILCAVGVALAIWARWILGTNWSGNPMIKEGHELIKAGPYQYIRHPIYSGILLGLFGVCIGGDRVQHLLFFAFALGVLVLKLRVEESLMMRQFPQAYPEYKKHTKTLIPFIV